MQERFESFFIKIEPYLSKISNHSWVRGLSTGMMSTLPFTVLGSFSLLLYVIPWAPLESFVSFLGIQPILSRVVTYTLGLLAVYMAVFVTRNIVHLTLEDDDGIAAGASALMSFFILTPTGTLENDAGGAIPTSWLSAEGAFTALIVSFITSAIFIWIKRRDLVIKMPEGVPPMVSNVFAGIVPTIVTGIFFIIIAFVFDNTGFGSVHQAVYTTLQAPMQELGGSLGALLLVSLLANLLWFFGIHGQNVLMPFIQPLWMALDVQNLQAIAAGETPPNIVGYAFYSLINFGGFQLALIFLLMRSKSKQFNQIGKLTLGPALFGVGEPLNFGLPLVLNFKFLIPFMTNSVIMLTASYYLIDFGLISHFNGSAHVFGLPVGVGMFIQAGVGGLILTALTQGLAVFLWYPWFKVAEKEALEIEEKDGVEVVGNH